MSDTMNLTVIIYKTQDGDILISCRLHWVCTKLLVYSTLPWYTMQIVIQTWIVKPKTSLSSESPLTKRVLNNVFIVFHLDRNLGVLHRLDNSFKFNDDWILEGLASSFDLDCYWINHGLREKTLTLDSSSNLERTSYVEFFFVPSLTKV